MKKRILASLMALCLVVGLLPTAALAAEEPEIQGRNAVAEHDTTAYYEFEDVATLGAPSALTTQAEDGMSGTCGATESDTVAWTLTKNEDGEDTYTLTISGTGAMADFPDAGTAPWYQLFPDKGAETAITAIEIGKDVTVIGANAFVWCKAVEYVEFEAGSALREIRLNGFHSLGKVTSIELPASLMEIGGAAFYDCSALEDVSFQDPDRLTVIGGSAFGSCDMLKSFNSDTEGVCNIPQNVTSIGDKAFSACTSLEAVNIPTEVETLRGTFWGCSKLDSVTFAPGSKVKDLSASGDTGTFSSTALTSIDLPESVETIGKSCFYHSKLESISIPSGVQSIGVSAFSACPLTSVTFAEDSQLKEIGDNAFSS